MYLGKAGLVTGKQALIAGLLRAVTVLMHLVTLQESRKGGGLPKLYDQGAPLSQAPGV